MNETTVQEVADHLEKMAESLDENNVVREWWPEQLREEASSLRRAITEEQNP